MINFTCININMLTNWHFIDVYYPSLPSNYHILNTTQLFNISLRFFIVKHRENGISRKFQNQRFYFYLFHESSIYHSGSKLASSGRKLEKKRSVAKPRTRWNVLLKVCLPLDTRTRRVRRFLEFLDIGSQQRKSWLRSIRQNYPCNLFREIPD